MNFRRPLVEALVGDGHEVSILAPSDESVTELQEAGCTFIELSLDRKGINPLSSFGLLRQMDKAFSEIRPHVIFGFTIKNNIFGALAANKQGIPFIPNVTGLGTAFLSGAAMRRATIGLYRFALRKCPLVFFQNEDDQALFLRHKIVDETQAILLPGSGIDLDTFAFETMPDRDGPVQFLMIARLLRDKGVVEYAEAARIVKASRPDAQCLILGERDTANRSAISAEMLGDWESSGTVRHLGKRDDVRTCIKEAHCVVLPSYREGAPRTLIEAAAMGRPLIATDVPGCRAVVDDGINGLLCAPRNGESLAKAMLSFIDMSPETKARMGLAGRAKMEREFSVERVVLAYRKAIAEATPTNLA